jgi:hypothetical protein
MDQVVTGLFQCKKNSEMCLKRSVFSYMNKLVSTNFIVSVTKTSSSKKQVLDEQDPSRRPYHEGGREEE